MTDDEMTRRNTNDALTSANRDQYDFLGKHMETYSVETSAVHRKLQSKIEALRILRKELEKFRVERDQYKLVAETLQLRYSALKCSNEFGSPTLTDKKSSVAALLHETREHNLKLSTEVESLKQKLCELQGDIELLRDKEAKEAVRHRRRSGGKTPEQTNAKEELQWKLERANFICHLENLKKKNAQLAFDFKALIDEKEEIITERDAYKCKAHRLNHELFVALKANKRHPKFLDIDGIILENKYLHERLKSYECELEMAKSAVNKYKTMLETKRKKGIVKLGTGNNDETILSPKQVKTILESGIDMPTKTETIHDLKSLCLALLDNLNDKNLALNHQKKTNKVLAMKINELEQRVQYLAGCETIGDSFDFAYAPSQLLLNGYCPSMADDDDDDGQENDIEKYAVEDGATLSSEADDEYNKMPQQSTTAAAAYSDDGMSSLSTESGRSILSSEYGIDVCHSDFVTNGMDSTATAAAAYKTSSATTDSGNCRTTPRISSAIARERMEDLKDLPPHLAAIVQKALHELDMRDFDEIVTTRADIAVVNVADAKLDSN